MRVSISINLQEKVEVFANDHHHSELSVEMAITLKYSKIAEYVRELTSITPIYTNRYAMTISQVWRC